jgi:hypothetical protein
MSRIISTVLFGAALTLAPALAFADESTTPPSPDRVQTPGNGPTISQHHRRVSRRMDVESARAASESEHTGYDSAGEMARPAWSGPSYSPYANMMPGGASADQ